MISGLITFQIFHIIIIREIINPESNVRFHSLKQILHTGKTVKLRHCSKRCIKQVMGKELLNSMNDPELAQY